MQKNLNCNFFTLEGGEGVGKTTVIKALKKELEESGYDVLITREPGGDHVSEKIRNIILDNEINIRTEVLLFAAARLEHLQNIIIPALNKGMIVISDRYVDSSIVYQEYVQGASEVFTINNYAIDGFLPIKTFLLDLDPKVAQKRIKENARSQNRYDRKNLEFHSNIRNKYLLLAEKNIERIKVIDASENVEQMVKKILKEMDK